MRNSSHENAADSSPLPITIREVKLVNAYLETGNATEAARQAGIVSTDDRAAGQLARKILAKDCVVQYLRECREEFMGAQKATTKKIANLLSHCAFADRLAIFDSNGEVKSPGDWPTALKSLVVGFDVKIVTDRDGNVTKSLKIRFADPIAAAKLLAEWKGMIGSRAALAENSGGADPGILVVLEGQPGSERPGENPLES